MLRVLLAADLDAAVVFAGVVVTLSFGLVLGYLAHRWAWHHIPNIGRRLPADSGAWLGIGIAGLFLVA